MLRLTKKIEYSLIALKHISSQVHQVSTVKGMSELYQIPRELLAKIMQQLNRDGLVRSVQGPKGGYAIAKPPQEINITQIIESIEGEYGFIECATHSEEVCIRTDDCVIRTPMLQINNQMRRYFNQITLADVINGKIPKPKFV